MSTKTSRERVLLVTADLGLADRIRKLLPAPAWEIVHAWCLPDGAEVVSTGRLSAVILHVGVPDSSGFAEFVRASLRHRGQALVVVADGYEPEAAAECLRLGAQDFVGVHDLASVGLERRMRHAIERSRHAQDRIGSMATKLLFAEERERRRLAVELHDQLGHNLAAASAHLGSVSKTVPSRDAALAVERVRDMVDDSIRYTRSLTYGLSSPLLREAGLVAAVEWLLDEHRKCHDMRFEIHDDGLAKPLDESMAAVLYQAVRELLVNVVRHANARLAVVTIERRQSEIRVSVQDDGVGIRVENMDRPIGFGLYSIRERLEFMGGSVEIDSAPGRGTRVDLVAPLGAEPR